MNKTDLEEIFDQHYTKMCSIAMKYTFSKTDAEDIVQDFFIYLWKRKNEISLFEIKNIDAFLYQAIRNRALNFLKSNKTRFNHSKESISYSLAYTKNENLYDNNRLKTKLDEAINNLPEKCKEIFLLSRDEGLRQKQIAEKLDISVKTVENQIGTALKKLRICLKPIYKEFLVENNFLVIGVILANIVNNM